MTWRGLAWCGEAYRERDTLRSTNEHSTLMKQHLLWYLLLRGVICAMLPLRGWSSVSRYWSSPATAILVLGEFMMRLELELSAEPESVTRAQPTNRRKEG